MKIASRIKKELGEFGWFAISSPLLLLILCGHFLSGLTVRLCQAYWDILKEIKHEDMG
jgi:hypothetical protein